MRSRQASYVLNDKEKKVFGAFKEAGETLEIEEMARRAFDTKRVGASPKSRGNSWVRNSVRKLLRLKLVSGGDRSGTYQRTELSYDDVFAKGEAERLAHEAKKAKKAEKTKKAKKAEPGEKGEPGEKAKANKVSAKPKAKRGKGAKKAADVVEGSGAEVESESDGSPSEVAFDSSNGTV